MTEPPEFKDKEPLWRKWKKVAHAGTVAAHTTLEVVTIVAHTIDEGNTAADERRRQNRETIDAFVQLSPDEQYTYLDAQPGPVRQAAGFAWRSFANLFTLESERRALAQSVPQEPTTGSIDPTLPG